MSKKIIAIVPAAGIGQRAQAGDALPKQYRRLNGEPMLRWAVKALLADARIDEVRVAVAAGDQWAAQALAGLPRTVWQPCGGPTRAATVAAALRERIWAEHDWVLVHDAARPGLPPAALARLIDACLEEERGGLLAQQVPDTVKVGAAVPDARDRAPFSQKAGLAWQVRATLDREGLWLAQTPQMFPARRLLAALDAAASQQQAVTDEASAMELAGESPRLIPGSARNFKVTWPEDFELMEKWLLP